MQGDMGQGAQADDSISGYNCESIMNGATGEVWKGFRIGLVEAALPLSLDVERSPPIVIVRPLPHAAVAGAQMS